MLGDTFEVQLYVDKLGDWFTFATTEMKWYAEVTMQALDEHYKHEYKFRIVGGRH